jgi:hypothetical protein
MKEANISLFICLPLDNLSTSDQNDTDDHKKYYAITFS